MTEANAPTDDLPTERQMNNRMLDLEVRGLTVKLECRDCGELTVDTVLPEERDDHHQTICKGCAEEYLRTTGLL